MVEYEFRLNFSELGSPLQWFWSFGFLRRQNFMLVNSHIFFFINFLSETDRFKILYSGGREKKRKLEP